MKIFIHSILIRFVLLVVILSIITGLSRPLFSEAQNTEPDSRAPKHTVQFSTDEDNNLPVQIQELKAKAAALEAAMEKRYPKAIGKNETPRKSRMGSMGMRMGSKNMLGDGDDVEMAELMKTMRTIMEMKMMQMKSKGMGGMQKGMSGMRDMMDNDMGMLGLMGRNNMGGKRMRMKLTTTLPGFPGASHIYHIGATGFFLDHLDHIQLTSEQQEMLNGIKEKTLLNQATSQRQIEEAEQELWALTASDKPDAKNIEAKVREIEKLSGDQRFAFIRAVGNAAKILTPEQRQILVDVSSSDTKTSTDSKN